MSRRFSEIVPQSPLEIERFFLDAIDKLKGTNSTLDELDQRSGYPGASVTSELERAISDYGKRITAPLRAQIDELERTIRGLQTRSLSTKVDDLERRIDSIERSARY